MSLPLFRITQTQRRVYDSYDSHVIAARTRGQVRRMAAEVSADEGPGVWNTARVVLLAREGVYKRPQIILSSFNAG